MQDADTYLAFSELIKRGWFQNKMNELEHTLQILRGEGRLTKEQYELLLTYCRDNHTGKNTSGQS
jgi:hypothetical protein